MARSLSYAKVNYGLWTVSILHLSMLFTISDSFNYGDMQKTLFTLKRNVRWIFVSELGGISHATILQSIIADRDS